LTPKLGQLFGRGHFGKTGDGGQETGTGAGNE
jgi:hypothetical protein